MFVIFVTLRDDFDREVLVCDSSNQMRKMKLIRCVSLVEGVFCYLFIIIIFSFYFILFYFVSCFFLYKVRKKTVFGVARKQRVQVAGFRVVSFRLKVYVLPRNGWCSLLLHGPSMLVVKTKIYGVLYKQSSSIAFEETSSSWSALKSA